jgi:hypothetical protein
MNKATPTHLRAAATVYVFGNDGYRKVRNGSNGFTCLVNRDGNQKGDNDLKPTCWDAEGSRTILPVMLRVGELIGRSASAEEIQRDWAERDVLKRFGAIVDNGRVVRDGNIITGGGVTAGLDFALVAIAEILGRATAENVQLRVEYPPAPPFAAGRPENVPAEVTARVRSDMSALLAADKAAVEEAARRLQAA